MITANQAVLWYGLNLAAAPDSPPDTAGSDHGSLFGLRLPTPDG
ncbi:hypothetical protein ACH4TV_03635 [Streptomyces sp. NPDC020898]